MEEPDLEELEWMASEQYPPEDDADAYFDDVSPQPEPPGMNLLPEQLEISKAKECINIVHPPFMVADGKFPQRFLPIVLWIQLGYILQLTQWLRILIALQMVGARFSPW